MAGMSPCAQEPSGPGSEGASGRDSGVQPIWRQGSFVRLSSRQRVCRECAGEGKRYREIRLEAVSPGEERGAWTRLYLEAV